MLSLRLLLQKYASLWVLCFKARFFFVFRLAVFQPRGYYCLSLLDLIWWVACWWSIWNVVSYFQIRSGSLLSSHWVNPSIDVCPSFGMEARTFFLEISKLIKQRMGAWLDVDCRMSSPGKNAGGWMSVLVTKRKDRSFTINTPPD